MKTITLLFILFFSTTGFAQENYTTRCEIKNGNAFGYVNHMVRDFPIDGTVWFHFYDNNGRFIKSQEEQKSIHISAELNEIEQTTAPLNAKQCYFDIKNAIKTENNQDFSKEPLFDSSNESYITSCEIIKDVAYGYVHNHDKSFQISGTVWFHFYDCNFGRLIESEDEYESEFVSSKSIEEIEHTKAPVRACYCTFDVKEAVKK